MATSIPLRLLLAPNTKRIVISTRRPSLATLRFIEDPRLDITADQREDLRALSLALVCGVVRHTDLAEYFRRFGVSDRIGEAYRPSWLSKPVRRDEAYLVLGKPYAMERLAGLPTTRTALTVYDRTLIDRSLRHPEFKDQFNRVLDEHGDSVTTAADLRSLIGEIVTCPEWLKFVSQFSYFRLSFLTNLYNFPQEDIRADLTEQAIRALYKRYPSFHNGEHMVNLAKIAARNHGNNLIKSYRAQQRDIMVNDGSRNRFTVVNQSYLNTLGVDGDSMLSQYENSAGEGGIVHDRITNLPTTIDQSNWETTRTLDTAVAMQPDTRLRRYLSVLRGEQDGPFSTYLGERSDEYADRVPFAQLNRRAAAFFNVDDEETDRVLRDVRNLFAEP